MKKFGDISIGFKVAFIVAIPLVFLILLCLSSFLGIQNLLSTQGWVDHTYRVLIEAGDIEKSLLDLETGQRGYLITGKPQFLEPYEAANIRLFEQFDSIKSLVDDNPAQVKRMEAIEALAKQWLEQAGIPEIEARQLVAQNDTDEIYLLDVVRKGIGKLILKNIRQHMDELSQLLTKAGNERGQHLVFNLEKDLIEMETGQRGFLLTGDTSYLQTYKKGKMLAAEHIDDIHTLLDNAYDAQLLKTLLSDFEKTVNVWLTQFSEPAIELRRQVNNGRQSINEIQRFLNQAKRQQLQLSLHGQLGQIKAIFDQSSNANGQNLMLGVTQSIAQIESIKREFLLTGQKNSLQNFQQAQNDLARYIFEVRALLDQAFDRPKARRTVATIADMLKDWHEKAAEPEIKIREKINARPATMQDIMALTERETGKKIMDQLRLSIDHFKDIELQLMEKRKNASQQSSNRLIWMLGLGTFFSVIGTLGLAAWITKKMIDRLRSTVTSVERIANADYSMPVLVQAADEVGVLGSAVNRLLDTLKETTHVASQIAKGQYDVPIPIKGEKDALGIALNQMTQALESNQRTLHLERQKLQDQDWIKTSYALIIEHIQGAKNIKILAEAVLNQLSGLIDARVGLFYQAEYDRDSPEWDQQKTLSLGLVATYAYQERKNLSNRFDLGEGLVGQCALERQSILLDHVPQDYIYITSGSGKVAPAQILVFPIVFEQRLLAVVEIGVSGVFTPLQINLIELLQDNLGVMLDNIYSYEKTQELLKTSQAQSQELQAQQEELRVTNENLEEQTKKLSLSEQSLKQQREELRVTNEELEEKQELLLKQRQAMQATKEEVEVKAAELEMASKYKSEFLANMSHELRTPLNSLLILSDALAKNAAGNLSAEQQKDAQVIYEGGKVLLELINDIMDLSKVEAGMLDLTLESVNLVDIGKRLESLFYALAREKGLAFSVNVEPEVDCEIYSDAQRLEQILRNFLSNAIKFTESGRVSLNIHLPDADTTFQNSALTHENTVAISVKDTGLGISDDKQAAIFEAFRQEDGSTSRQFGGTGLGLAISRQLAFLLHGEIQLTSQKHKGSQFTLYVPKRWEAVNQQEVINGKLIGSNPHSSVKANIKSLEDARSEKLDTAHALEDNRHWLPDDRHAITSEDPVLLIIEDDPHFAKILQKIARSNHFKTLLTEKGRQGVLLAYEYKPSGIILDLTLPDVDGLHVLEQLKTSLETRHIPIHVASAHMHRRLTALQKGAISFVPKPASEETIRLALNNIHNALEADVKKVLVVEDDPGGQRSIEKLLASKDIHIIFSDSLADALTQLKTPDIDCIILDLNLPDAKGAEVVETIARHKDFVDREPPVPIIVYTGQDITDEEHRLLKEFASSIVIKGVSSPERLLDDVSLFLHRIGKALPRTQHAVLQMLHDDSNMLKDRRVLLVDDDMRNIFAIKRKLDEFGLQVTTADNGQEALELVKQTTEPFEIILMDIMMPVKNGYEAIQEIRNVNGYAETPILALTAKAMPEDRQLCLKAGASDYLTKPIDPERLISMLRVWLFQSTHPTH